MVPQTPRTTDRVALVTGASRGIGAHIATALAQAGWKLALTARSDGALTDVTARLRSDGATVLPLACDVTDSSDVDQSVRRVVGELGGVDLLVNNAGLIESEVPLWDSDIDEWWQVLVTNVRGPYLMTRAVVPRMIERGGGRIVNMNSGSGTRESPVLSAYTASKSALARITGSTAAAGAEHGVHAFDLAPGVVQTDMTASMEMHTGRTEWTDPADVTALLLAMADGQLDAFSGRLVRAGADTLDSLRARAEAGLGDGARMLRLRPWGDDDPVAR